MLRFVVRNRQRNLPKAEGVNELGQGSGPQGRIDKMRKLVTALVRHERIEGYFDWVDESRGYTERLIQEAIKHGDQHARTMEIADYYLLEKDLIHKLFKVLVPRYHDYTTSYTQLWHLPTVYPGKPIKRAILELKGNPWPPVVPHVHDVRGNLINVLVDQARHNHGLKRSNNLSSRIKQPTPQEHLQLSNSSQSDELLNN